MTEIRREEEGRPPVETVVARYTPSAEMPWFGELAIANSEPRATEPESLPKGRSMPGVLGRSSGGPSGPTVCATEQLPWARELLVALRTGLRMEYLTSLDPFLAGMRSGFRCIAENLTEASVTKAHEVGVAAAQRIGRAHGEFEFELSVGREKY